ncbi:hypothetical protein BS78_01G303200 [Paspalum vaginatum]|nr:hypothetical protein BS78_01G303200 [Paspalum vaginatum]
MQRWPHCLLPPQPAPVVASPAPRSAGSAVGLSSPTPAGAGFVPPPPTRGAQAASSCPGTRASDRRRQRTVHYVDKCYHDHCHKEYFIALIAVSGFILATTLAVVVWLLV